MTFARSSVLRRRRLLGGVALAVLVAAPLAAESQVLPTGGVVAQGAVTIAPSVGGLTVSQSSQRSVINWTGFSVGQGQAVAFAQPGGQSATLNRVTGPGASTIAGSITSNGAVYLVNPNGLQITASGVIDTRGGFVGSTLDIADADFMAGRLTFNGSGASRGIVNQGSILSGGGLVALLAGHVDNQGSIVAPLGRVAIGAGEAAVLDLTGDGFLRVALPSDATDASGALIASSGAISAQGGQIEIKAATVRSALREAVNLSGVIDATGISGRDGLIVLDAGEGGTAKVSGRLDVSGPGTGGRIDVTGQTVAAERATFAATGADRGGLVRLGGAFQGGKAQAAGSAEGHAFVHRFGELPSLASAEVTTLDQATRIDVSSAGDGGAAVLWSSKRTDNAAAILATGGRTGGAVELSSEVTLSRANLGGIEIGRGGRLLLDPTNIYVSAGGSDPVAGNSGYGTAGDASLNNGEIATLLGAGTDVSLQAHHDITWTDGLTVTPSGAAGALRLSAGNGIFLDSGDFDLGGGDLTATIFDLASNGVDEGLRDANFPEFNSRFIDIVNAGDVEIRLGQPNFTAAFFLGKIEAETITASAPGANRILMAGNLTATGAVSVTGTLQPNGDGGEEGGGGSGFSGITLSGSTVTWTDEATAELHGPSAIRFIESGVMTRFGRHNSTSSDAVRLGFGSGAATSPQYTRRYGDANPDFTPLHVVKGTLEDGVSLDDILAAGSIDFDPPDPGLGVGTYDLTFSAGSGFALADGVRGYFIDTRPVVEQLEVLPSNLTVTLAPTVRDGAYVYGSPTWVVHLAGIVGSDDVAPVANVSGLGAETLGAVGSGDFSFRYNLPIGSRSYTLTGLAGTSASNYTLDLTGVIAAALDITARPVSYYLPDEGHTYGDTPTVTALLGNVAGGDSVFGAIAVAGGHTFDDHLGAGTYGLSVGALTGADAGNYVIDTTPFANRDATYTVTPRALTWSVADSAATYGTAATLGAITLGGVRFGDDVSGVSALSIDARTAAGTYVDTVAGLTGTKAANYTLAATGNTDGALVISPKTLSFSRADGSQVYGSSTPLVTLSGVLAGDEVFVDASGFILFGDGAYGAPAETHVGAYSFDFTGLAGAEAGNYSVDFAGARSNLTVTPKALTYTVPDITQTYGAAFSPYVVTLHGLVGSDNVYAAAEGFQGGVQTTLGARPKAGGYVLRPLTLEGVNPGDYTLAATGNTDGLLTIDPKALTYQVPTLQAQYGAAAGYAALTGVESGDAVSPITRLDKGGTISIQTLKTAPGTYAASVSGLDGADAGNYVIAGAGNTDGVLTILPRVLTYTTAAASSTYGTLATLGAVTLSGQGGVGVLAGDDVAAAASVAGLTSRTGVGTYAQILAALGGADAANYVIAAGGHSAGLLTIAPKSLTYTIGAASQTYGSVTGGASALTGVLSGDQVEGVAGLVIGGATVQTAVRTAVGTYGQALFGLSGAASGNYTIAAGGHTAGTLTVTPRALTGAVTPAAYAYGSPGAVVSLSGVLGGDAVSPTATLDGAAAGLFAIGAGFGFAERTAAGSHTAALTGLSGADAANYSLANPGVSAALTITPKPLTWAVSDAGSTYGTVATTGAVSLNGVLSGDAVAGGLTVSRSGAPVTLAARTAAGAYNQTVTSLSGAQAGNYEIAASGHTAGVLTIAPKALTYAIGDSASTYGTLGGAGPISLTGVLSGDAVEGVAAFDRAGAPVVLAADTPVGAYRAFLAGLTGAEASNYSLGASGNTDGVLTISPKALTYLLTGASRVYGTPGGGSSVSLEGVLAGDDVDAALTVVGGGALAANTPVGDYVVGVGGLTGASASNYILGGAGGATLAGLTITPRPLTYAIAGAGSTYGTLATLGAASLSGLVAGDSVSATVALSGGVALDDRLHAGTYGQTVTGLTGASAGNYVLAASGNSDGGLTVARRVLGVNYLAPVVSYTYGSPVDLLSLSGVLSGDEVIPTLDGGRGTVTLQAHGSNWIAAPNGLKVDSFIRAYVNGLTGASAADYTVNVTNALFTRVIVNPKPVSILFTGHFARTYGDAPQATFNFDGLLAGDQVSPFVTGSLGGAVVDFGGGYFGFGNPLHAGTRTYEVAAITGRDGFNYVINPAQSIRGGAFAITPRTVRYTLALNTPHRPTGTVNAVFGSGAANAGPLAVSVSNIVPGDPVPNVIAFSPPTDAQGNRTPGTYVIKAELMTGASPGDYLLDTSGAGDLTLNVTAGTLKVLGYDGIRSATYGSGLTLPSLTVDNNYANNTVFALPYLQAGGAPTLLGDRTPAGTYSVVFNGFTGPNAAYYTADLSSYEPATFTINPRLITSSLASFTRTYGDPLAITMPSLNGVLGGDEVKVAALRVFKPTGAGGLGAEAPLDARVAVGGYYMEATLGGAQADNYRLGNQFNFGGTQSTVGVMTVTPRVISATVNTDKLSLTYGDAAEPVSFGNILAGDDVSIRVLVDASTRSQVDFATARLPAGTYRTVVSEPRGADAANYDLPDRTELGLKAGFVIRPKPLTYAIQSVATAYGTPAGITGELFGVLSGETVTFGATTYNANGGAVMETPYTEVGAYIRRVTSLSSPNYAIAGTGNQAGGLSITPKMLSVAINPGPTTRTYGDLTEAAVLSGVLPLDDVALTGSLNGDAFGRLTSLSTSGEDRAFSFAEKTGAGTWTTRIGGLTGARAANYALATPANSASLTVTPKPLLYAVADATGRYGGYLDCLPGVPRCNPHTGGFGPGGASFVGVLPGDQVSGVSGLIDFAGETFTYRSNLKPGTYFEVLTGLSGTSAANYTIAPTGNRPGVMTIKPGWITWATSNQVNIFGSSPLGVGGRVTALNGVVGADEVIPVVILAAANGRTPVDPTQPLTASDYTFPVVQLVGKDAANYELWNELGGYNTLGRLTLLPSSLGLNYTQTLPAYVAPPPAPSTTSTDPSIRAVSGIPALFANPFSRGEGVTTGTETAAGTTSTSAGAGADASGSETQTLLDGDTVDLEAQEYATVTALAKAGVTGVTINFDQNAGVDVRLESGPGYVQVGVEQTSGGSFEIKLLSTTPHIEVGADVTAGAYVQGGADGSLGAIGDGYIDATTGVLMFARTGAEIGYQDGRVTTEFDNAVGVTYTAGASGGISGGSGSIDGSATIYAPGAFGEQFKVDGGYSDGDITVNINIGLEIGIVGFEFGFGFSLDIGSVVDAVSCVFSDCSPPPPPTPAQIVDGALGYSRKTQPNELYAYMSANRQYLDPVRIDENFTYQFDRSLTNWYRGYTALQNDLKTLVSDEQAFTATVAAMQAAGDAQGAADYITRNLSFLRARQTNFASRADDYGVKVAVQDGKLTLVNK